MIKRFRNVQTECLLCAPFKHELSYIATVLLIFIGNEHWYRRSDFMCEYRCWRSGRFVFCSDLNAAVHHRHIIRGCSVAAGTVHQQFGPYSIRNLTVDLFQPFKQFGFKVLRPFGAPFVEQFYLRDGTLGWMRHTSGKRQTKIADYLPYTETSSSVCLGRGLAGPFHR